MSEVESLLHDLSETDMHVLGEVIDTVTAEYLRDHQIVFDSDSDRLAEHYGFARGKRRDWQSSRLCRFFNCTKRAIQRSHTIPRASLDLIASNGHLLTPVLNWDTGELGIDSIGIGQASTFPGFCTDHENLFAGFESRISMNADADYLLQIYRTVCREVALKEHQIRQLALQRQIFGDRLEEWALRRITELLNERLPDLRSETFTGFRISRAGILAYSEKKERELQHDLESFRECFLSPFTREDEVLPLAILKSKLPEHIPVALSGRGNFWIKQGEDGEEINVVAILNAIPMTNGYHFFICVREENSSALNAYKSLFLQKHDEREALLSMLESWMLYGSDHWFISPEFWEDLPDEIKESIPRLILDTNCNIGHYPEVSLLDAVRY